MESEYLTCLHLSIPNSLIIMTVYFGKVLVERKKELFLGEQEGVCLFLSSWISMLRWRWGKTTWASTSWDMDSTTPFLFSLIKYQNTSSISCGSHRGKLNKQQHVKAYKGQDIGSDNKHDKVCKIFEYLLLFW